MRCVIFASVTSSVTSETAVRRETIYLNATFAEILSGNRFLIGKENPHTIGKFLDLFPNERKKEAEYKEARSVLMERYKGFEVVRIMEMNGSLGIQLRRTIRSKKFPEGWESSAKSV